MTKTQNFNLNKPEVTDSIRVSDFNENADKIDGLLKQVDDNSVTRSAQVRSEAANALAAYKTSNDAAVAALNTAAAGFGNCKIATGTYKGTNKYGSANPTKLEVGFAPKLVLIGFDGDRCRLFTPVLTKKFDFGSSFSSEDYTATWGDTYFSMYCSSSAYGQMNSSDRTYNYIVIG